MRCGAFGEAQDVTIKPVQILIYNTRETIITRAYVKGFVIHPIEYNLGLLPGVAGQVGQRRRPRACRCSLVGAKFELVVNRKQRKRSD